MLIIACDIERFDQHIVCSYRIYVAYNIVCDVSFDQMGVGFGGFEIIIKDGLTRIEKDRNLIGIVNQSRFKFLADECTARRIDLEYLCVSMSERIAHVERHEGARGFGSHQFWHGLRMALDLDGIIGCCPLVAPSSFPYSSWDGTSADWGYLL